MGLIEGTSAWTGMARQAGYQNALNELLDKAAAKGADFIVLDPSSRPTYWTTHQIVHGEAYKRK